MFKNKDNRGPSNNERKDPLFPPPILINSVKNILKNSLHKTAKVFIRLLFMSIIPLHPLPSPRSLPILNPNSFFVNIVPSLKVFPKEIYETEIGYDNEPMSYSYTVKPVIEQVIKQCDSVSLFTLLSTSSFLSLFYKSFLWQCLKK